MKLSSFLNPKSVAVIGASSDPKKLGNQILSNLKINKFKGRLYPINLNEKKILGFKAYKEIGEVKSKIDLAVIVIPSQFVAGEVKKCAQAGIKNIIIISAGFSEVDEAGKEKELEIKRIAEEHKLNILGPNCLGVINTDDNFNATFARVASRSGTTAFISQSGAICSAVLDWAKDKQIGFSKFVSMGNKAVLDENDFLEYFINDKNTKMVVAYLEEIGDGQRFMQAASALSKIKPVAILKAGQTKAGAEAAMSHTGSLAGSSEATLAGLRRAGVIILEDFEEMINLLAVSQRPVDTKNPEIYMISNAGGPLVLLADQVARLKLNFGRYSVKTCAELKKKLPYLNTPHNPLDIIGDADAMRYKLALETILRDKNVSNILILLTPQTSTEVEKTAKAICDLAAKHKNKLICTSFIGGESLTGAIKLLEKNKIINFTFPDQALKVIAKIINYKTGTKELKAYHYKPAKNIAKKGEQLDYLESLALLKKYGIPTLETRRIDRPEDLLKLNYPIALKVVGKKLIHKTEIKAVSVNLKNEKEASMAYAKFTTLLIQNGNYCVAQPMIEDGMELILGFKRDQSFGPIIMVGMGGIYTEVFKDISTGADDIDLKQAEKMIGDLRIAKILYGVRGGLFETGSLAKAIVNLARLARGHSEIQELDINPLFIDSKGILAADVRIIV